ncbi:hypothetical protein K438DRAFT_1101634 [Mycena galopus ATCC 62051]|nr:hypothetical protein K438DRAFT_1101634 [Mycena galopus ATCC 62051]
MFHQSYPSALSYRSPVSQPGPREKYLAALAEAKAAEAEYLAAEQLQQEEDQLRQRLEQIQRLKHQPSTYYIPTQPLQPPQPAPLDLDALRRQITAEERARIVREQELETLRVQESQRKARKLEALRIHEAREAQQAARNIERSRALAARRAELQALTQRALAPSVHFVASEDALVPRAHHGRPHHRATYPEFRNSVQVPVLPGRHYRHAHDCGSERKPTQEPRTSHVEIVDLVNQLFGGRAEARAEPPKTEVPAPTAPQAASLEHLLQHIFGGKAAPQTEDEVKPATEAAPQPRAEAPMTLDQLIGHFLGAAGVETEQSKPSTSSTTVSAPAPSSEKKEADPASQSAPAAKPAPAPTPAAQPVGLEQILGHFLGAAGRNAASNQAGAHEVDLQQLFNMFLDGAAPAPAQPQVRKFVPLIVRRGGTNNIRFLKAGPSKSASASTNTNDPTPTVKKTEREEREERELQEAIRMSLADSQPSSTTSENKGKAPAPAPVKDVASSTAEVHAIDASFSALSNEFVFPTQLDFSTSRTSSPTRSTAAEESVMANLSYSAQNQPVRFYHQALSGLLAKLDAVESFGDEGLRHERKEVVGRVEGAMDEVERVVEAKWRKWAGRERAVDSAPSPQIDDKEEQDAPLLVAAEDVNATDAAESAESVEVAESEPVLVPESITESAVEADATLSSPSPPANEPLSAAESVVTLRPSSPAPSDADEVSASPAPSTIDTFLLPASATTPVIQKKPRASDSDVGSDWSELDA